MTSIFQKRLIQAYVHEVQQSMIAAVIIPQVIMHLISIYFYDWIMMAQKDIGHSAPPQLVVDLQNDDEYILISPKGRVAALLKYYEDGDKWEQYESRPMNLYLDDNTISVNQQKSLVYFVGGYRKEFAIYSLSTKKWITTMDKDALSKEFDCSWYSPSVYIENQFHWISTNHQTHFVWNDNENKWHLSYQFKASEIDAVTMVYIEKLNQIMLIAAAARFAKDDNQKQYGSIWFSSEVKENSNSYNWTKSDVLKVPFSRKLFGWIKCDDMLVIFGGIEGGHRGKEQFDEIWVLKMNGMDVSEWKWRRIALKCPKTTWYHAVLTEKNNNVHLFDSYDGKDHWMINFEAIAFSSQFNQN